MEPASELTIKTEGDGIWLVSLEMHTGEAERMSFTLRIPVQTEPSPTVHEMEQQVLRRAADLIQQMLA